MVCGFERPAADGRFRETQVASMQRGQALVQTDVAGRLRQSAQQGHNRFVGQIVRKKQVGIRNGGADGDGHVGGVRLINHGCGRFQLFRNHGTLFGGDQPGG